MKKKLTFMISLLLVLTISVCAFITPASSFKNDVETSSYAMLLINLDTRTVVYSLRADKPWNASYMSELMTFLLMTEIVSNPEEISIKVDEEFIKGLKHSDGCLNKYLGEELTLKDIAAIMLLTSGSDAAFLIANYLSSGDINAFIDMMNARAARLGCKQTAFESPGYSESKTHITTCLNLSRLYNRLMNNELYKEIMSSPKYIPAKYEEDESYAVTTENSIMNPVSPYYFRYATGGKFACDPVSGASIVVTTNYQESKYMFVALRGKNEAEENVFTDARHLTTWAYLNLSDRKVIDTETSVGKATAIAGWGQYDIDLYADNSARKTLPNEFEQNKFSVKMDIPGTLQLPLFEGERVCSADILYDGERLDKVRIVSKKDEGVSMLHDLGRFGGYALSKMFPNTPVNEAAEQEEEALTEPPANAPKEAAPTEPVASEEEASQETAPTTETAEAETEG